MSTIMISCSQTGHGVSTGIDTDATSFANLPDDTPSQLKCPLCGRVHVWWKREAWLSADGGDGYPALSETKPKPA